MKDNLNDYYFSGAIEHLAEFDISWSGPGDRENEICYGSEDGRLAFGSLLDGTRNVTNKIVDGAVNGVAFRGGAMAISSPNEFVVRSGLDSTNDIHSPVDIGAHGVIGLQSNVFAAPADGPD